MIVFYINVYQYYSTGTIHCGGGPTGAVRPYVRTFDRPSVVRQSKPKPTSGPSAMMALSAFCIRVEYGSKGVLCAAVKILV